MNYIVVIMTASIVVRKRTRFQTNGIIHGVNFMRRSNCCLAVKVFIQLFTVCTHVINALFSLLEHHRCVCVWLMFVSALIVRAAL